MLYSLLPANASVLLIIWMVKSMQRPFIHAYAYSILIMLSTTIIATAVFTSLMLLFHYCYYYKTVTTDKPLRASLLLGVAELITHLLRLINILWLPLYRINKFGFYFPQRLLRSRVIKTLSRSLKWMRGKWRTAWWTCRSCPSPSILQRSASLGGGIGRSWRNLSLQ